MSRARDRADGDFAGKELIFDADGDTSITADTDDQIDIKIAGSDQIKIAAGEVAFNEASGDIDFRVESNGDANCLFVDGGNDEVGIGTNTPSSHSSPNGAKLVVNTSGATFLQLNGGSSASCGVEFTDGAAAGQIHYYHGDNSLNFSAQGASSGLSLLASGNVNIADGNLVVASGHGISFAATGDGAATDTSELFADYEEGTWTPVYRTGASAASYAQQYGRYVRVGGIVYAQFWLLTASSGFTANGAQVSVQGLPYAIGAASDSQDQFARGFGQASFNNHNSNHAVCYGLSGQTYFEFYYAGSTGWIFGADGNAQNSKYIIGGFQYSVDM